MSRDAAGAAAVAGGLLWIPYGVLELLAPFGTDAVWSEARGYEVVEDRWVHVLYGGPGTLALLATAVALLVLLRTGDRRRPARAARGFAWAAVAMGAASVAGLAAGFDALATAPRVLGTAPLGVAALLAAGRLADRRLAWHVATLGTAAALLVGLWPLVWALGGLSSEAAVGLVACFGAGWVALGWRVLDDDRAVAA